MDKENHIKDSQGVIINILKIRSSVNSYLSVFTYYIIIFFMYRNSFKIFFLIISLIIFIFPLSARPKDSEQETNVYYKYTHPRDYVFDLSDSKEKVVLKFDDSIGKLSCKVDFTHLVKEQMPRKGDRITFKYQFVPSKNVKNITAFIFDMKKGINLGNKTPELFSKPVAKKSVCSKEFSIILNDDAELSLVLYLQSSTEDKKDKIELSFNRILESTNIKKEIAEEKNAIKKGYKIVPVTIDFGVKGEEDNVTNPQEDIVEVEEQNLQNTEKEEKEIQENDIINQNNETTVIEEESNQIVEESVSEIKTEEKTEANEITSEKENVENKEEKSEVIIEVTETQVKPVEDEQEIELHAIEIDTSTEVPRYQKEYLQDFAVTDEIIVDEVVHEEIKLIEEPDEADINGCTLLMNAAKNGNDWQIKTLLQSGAKVNLQDKDGWTALMYAVRYQDNINIIDLLIDNGANIKIKNKYDTSALIIASCYNNNPEVIKKLLSYYSTSEKEVLKALVNLISDCHAPEFIQIAKLNTFLNFSVPLNTFYNGKTPLMYAAEFSNSTKIIKILIDNNAITTLRSTEGKTAFDYAKDNNNLKHDSNYWLLNKK